MNVDPPKMLWQRNQTGPWLLVAVALFLPLTVQAEPVSLQALVTPSTVIQKDGKTVRFAIHGLIEFDSLSTVLLYRVASAALEVEPGL